jgi:hypothetical protein
MNRCENEIENAKRAVVVEREWAWRRHWAEENKKNNEKIETAIARAPVPPYLVPETWVTFIWNSGCLVMDANDYNKIPAKKRRSFEKSIR